MTRDELFDKLRPIVMAATGVPECILADDNGPAPTGEYASIEPVASIGERGQAIIRQTAGGTSGTASTRVESQLIAECSVNFYRGDARTRAVRLKQANKRPAISAALRAAKLGWNRTGPVNNLTALQSNQREQRAQISIFIMYVDTPGAETSGAIEHVDFTIIDYDTDAESGGSA